MWPTLLIIAYCILIVLASLGGGWLPSLIRLTHTRMQLIMSFVGGLMLGVALLHLLPHSVAHSGSADLAVWSTLAGLLAMFFLIRIFHVHQHETPETVQAAGGPELYDVAPADAPAASADEHAAHSHSHDHSQDHSHSHGAHAHGHQLSWLGLVFGLALHTLIDGIALAAAVAASAAHEPAMALLGVGTFLAILLHKPLDALTITSVMAAGGWSSRTTSVVNMAFAAMCPLGALSFYLGVQDMPDQEMIVGGALGFAAGVFLCISLSDILPEVHFHAHDRVKLSAALLVGVVLAWGVGFLEPEHLHSHGSSSAPEHAHEEHSHEEHSHEEH